MINLICEFVPGMHKLTHNQRNKQINKQIGLYAQLKSNIHFIAPIRFYRLSGFNESYVTHHRVKTFSSELASGRKGVIIFQLILFEDKASMSRWRMEAGQGLANCRLVVSKHLLSHPVREKKYRFDLVLQSIWQRWDSLSDAHLFPGLKVAVQRGPPLLSLPPRQTCTRSRGKSVQCNVAQLKLQARGCFGYLYH